GALSARVAAIGRFAAGGLAARRLGWAVLAEPADPEVAAVRIAYRRALAAEIAARLAAAISAGHLPEQDTALAAPAVVGALIEGLVGPLAPELPDDPAKARAAAQTLTLLALRAPGAVEARAGWWCRRRFRARRMRDRRRNCELVCRRRWSSATAASPRRSSR